MVLHTPLEGRSSVVTASSRKARLCGVHPGLPLAEARTLVPNGWFLVHDSEADVEGLKRLAWQCQRFTPRAGLEPAAAPDSLFLDVTGCVHLFGDLPGLCHKVVEHFEQQEYSVRLAAAVTFGAAWGLARYGRRVEQVEATRGHVEEVEQVKKGRGRTLSSTFSTGRIAPSTCSTSALAPLPLAALRLPAETLALLVECGIRTIAQLSELPRSTLPARFGKDVLLRLDQACGKVEELLEPELPPEPVTSQVRLEFPLTETAAVLHLLEELLEKVLHQVRQRQRVTQQVLTSWKTEQGEHGDCTVRLLRPTTSKERIWELINLKLEGLQLPGGVTELGMEVVPCRSQTVRKKSLFESNDTREAEFLNLIERLSSRLGEDAVVCQQPVAEYQPELAYIAVPWISGNEKRRARSEAVGSRGHSLPCRLLKSPVPIYVASCPVTGCPQSFHWQNNEHNIALCEGPERISTGWWRASAARRDYYRVETVTGARFWLFHVQDLKHWFLHGIYD